MAARRSSRPRRVGAEPTRVEELTLDREAVRYWRLQRGWTQEALAARRVTLEGQAQSFSYAQIRRIESGGRCGPTSARILAALLDVPLSQLSPRDGRHLPCGLPREPSIDFVGREGEIKDVLAALGSRGSVRIAASIEGLPGIGKTELALQICGLCERERRFRTFWFDAEQPDLTPTWADVVAPHLGIAADTPEQRASQALRAIESLPDPVLLVLDNVEAWSASRPWPRPRGRHIHWLVTTRRSDLGGREFHHIDVPVLERAAAERLMARIAGPEITSRPGFGPLMDLLGGYTIAVELAATFLRRFPDVEPDAYRTELERGTGAELEEEVGGRTFYGQTLERALELLWDRLPGRTRRHWQLAAQFAQAPATPALSDACGLDRRARAELRDYHLIETHAAKGWSMHRLVRAFGQSAGEREPREAARLAFFRGCVERAEQMDLPSGFTIYVPDRDHYELALEHPAATADSEAVAWLHARVGTALASQGDPRRSETVLERGRLLAREHLGSDVRVVFFIETVLGDLLLRAGDLSASRQLLEDVIARAARTLGSDDEAVIEARNNLSIVVQVAGDLAYAKTLRQEVLAAGQRVFEGTDPRIAMYRAALSYALFAQGDLEGAKQLQGEALRAEIDGRGEDHPMAAVYRNNLALVLRDLGDLQSAREHLERALEVDLVRCGECHPNVAIRRSNLASVLRELGEFARARRLVEQALEWTVASLGEEHPDVAARRSNLAVVLADLGELTSAKQLLEGALEADRVRFGEDHPTVALRRFNLGSVLRDMGDLKGAKALLESSVESGLDQLGPDHPSVAERQSELAWVLRALGDLHGARELISRALDCWLERRSREHPATAQLRSRLAEVLHQLGAVSDAEAEAREALRVARLQPPGWRGREAIEAIARAILGS